MPYLLLGALVLVVLRGVSAPVSNADTFFHLRYGREFLDGWSLRSPGHVSDFGQRDWAPTQWASQMLMAMMESGLGLPGVVWLTGAVALVTVVAVFVVARQYADPLAAVVVAILFVLATSNSLTPRPQVVSYLLVLVFTQAWLRSAADLRPRWWLVPVTWVWAMLHGMWPIGALIGFVAVLGIALDNRSRLREVRPSLLRLLAVPVASLAIAALTPVGPRLYGAVLVVGGRSRFHDEWAATDFHVRQPAIVAAMIVVTLLVWLLAREHPRPSWVAVLLLLLAAAWSAYAVRTVPIAAAMAVPFLAGSLQALVARRRATPRREPTTVAGIALGAVVLLALVAPVTADRPAATPSWLDPALEELPEGTAVQTADFMGGYLLWRHPDLDPVIDGYSDAYTTRHLQEQLDLQSLRRGWDTRFRASGVRFALLPTGSRLTYALLTFEDWRVLHTSKAVTMLEAPESWPR